jgi:hypothetical protein
MVKLVIKSSFLKIIEVQRCRGGEVHQEVQEVQGQSCRGELQRYRVTEVQRCRIAEKLRCNGAMVQWCNCAMEQWCNFAVVQRCGGAEVKSC